MLDINLFRNNPEIIKADLKKRGMDTVLADKIIKLDAKNRELLTKVEEARAQKNAASEKIAALKGDEKQSAIDEMKTVGETEKAAHTEQSTIQKELNEKLAQIPNITHDTTPEGPDESGNKIEATEGNPPKFDFEPKDHVTLGQELGLLNIEDAVNMSGTRFAYLMGEAVLLEFALLQFVMHKLVSKGFTPVVPPVLVKENAMFATGFFPADRNEIYHVNASEDEEDGDDLYLAGTSEVPLTMLNANKILNEETLPLRYAGFSTCFRREAGSYGKDTHGIIRVHQFDKIEMFSFCHPDKSWEEHDFIRSVEEEIMQEIGLPYQVLNICSGDLGFPAAKKYDIEAWIPTQDKYRELTSCSNCTDYQARRAKIRYKSAATGKNEFVHTLNGTAVAIGRMLVAIIENFQQKDGSIEIPHVLQPYMNGVTKIEK